MKAKRILKAFPTGILFLCTILSQSAVAGITSLRHHIEKSDLIAIGTVESVKDITLTEKAAPADSEGKETVNALLRKRVTMRLTRILKGPKKERLVLDVLSYPATGHATPPSFEKGKTALLFLHNHKEKTTPHLLGSDEAVLPDASSEAVKVYTTLINEFLKILQETDKKAARERTMEWLVKCVENQTTRRDTLSKIDPYRIPISKRGSDLCTELTAKHRERLFALLKGLPEGGDHHTASSIMNILAAAEGSSGLRTLARQHRELMWSSFIDLDPPRRPKRPEDLRKKFIWAYESFYMGRTKRGNAKESPAARAARKPTVHVEAAQLAREIAKFLPDDLRLSSSGVDTAPRGWSGVTRAVTVSYKHDPRKHPRADPRRDAIQIWQTPRDYVGKKLPADKQPYPARPLGESDHHRWFWHTSYHGDLDKIYWSLLEAFSIRRPPGMSRWAR